MNWGKTLDDRVRHVSQRLADERCFGDRVVLARATAALIDELDTEIKRLRALTTNEPAKAESDVLAAERAAREEAEESRALWQGRAQRAEEDLHKLRCERDEEAVRLDPQKRDGEPAPPLSAATLSRLADMGRTRGWRSTTLENREDGEPS